MIKKQSKFKKWWAKHWDELLFAFFILVSLYLILSGTGWL